MLKTAIFVALFSPTISFSFYLPEKCGELSSYCIFVSPSGAKSGSGEIDSPLYSLIDARNKARKFRELDSKANIYIYLREGEYNLSEPIVLGNEYDAGVGNTEWTAFPGEDVILSGTEKLQKQINFNDSGVYKIGVASRIVPRELYFNDQKLIRARWPNYPKKSVIKNWYEKNITPTNTDSWDRKIAIDNNNLPSIKDYKNIELHLDREFSKNILKITKVDTYNDISYFFFDDGNTKNAFDQKFPRKWNQQSFYLEGSIELLDSADEWFFDEVTKEIYVFLESEPCKKLNNCNYHFPAIKSIFKIVGFSGKPFNNVVISNIKFKHVGLSGAVNGYVPSQAGVYFIDNGAKKIVPGVIDLTYVDGVKIENCVFDGIGTHAIVANKGVANLTIINNNIINASSGGVYVDTHLVANPTEHDAIKNIIVKNNTIKKIGLIYDDSVAIFSGYAFNVKIQDNIIEDVPYSAISVGWGWTSELTALGSNLISGNFIKGGMKNLTDGGGIYLLSRQDNTIVENNYISLSPGYQTSDFDFVAGIYLDKGVAGVVVKNNFVEIFGGSKKSRHIKYFNQIGNIKNVFLENK